MLQRLVFICFYLSIFVYINDGQVCQGEDCVHCISSGSVCRWCSQDGFSNVASLRCDNITNLEKKGCKKENIIAPDSNLNYVQFENVTDGDSKGLNAIQLSPQLVDITATPNFPMTIPITFRAARNYPVDLYFLFDLSKTMKQHKSSLSALADEMAGKIQSISRNYRFGFGYFQDKVILPFTKPWIAGPSEPFGYRHVLSLTQNITAFQKVVEEAPLSGNIDIPEGGLDAIMQAVSCETEIGWRKKAHKLIIYSSDAIFHYAGDGKLAGIVLPNDGKCHLVNGSNTEELNQDYPSIGQISQIATDKGANIIFAILKKVEDQYRKLSENIHDSYVGVMEGDSSNVVDIVRSRYEAIISEVKFRIEASDDVVVKLFSNCNGGGMVQITECRGTKIGQEIKLQAQIYGTRCSEDWQEWNKTIVITPEKLSDKLTINLQLDCDCQCKNSEKDSSKCSSQGTYQCGICNCNPGRYGDRCQCSEFEITEGRNHSACVRPNTTVKCMGRGDCKCGRCNCNEGYNGQFCECDINACERFEGQTCGGAERGRCVCETCVCNAGYDGNKCECPLSTESCLSADGSLCSGKGKCECGKCSCDSPYIGSKCEACPTCPGACIDNKECVECFVFNEGLLTPEQCQAKCSHVQIVDSIEDLNTTCQIRDSDDCKMIYRINYMDNGNTTITAQKYKVCPQDVDMIPIIAGVLGGIVAIGIFLMALWKILTSLYDGIEYAKFQQDLDQANWARETNPIYKGATSTYKNPMCEEMD